MLRVRSHYIYFLLAFFAIANIAPFAHGISPSSQKDRILLCTEAGYQWVQVDKDNPPPKNSPERNPLLKECPLCYLTTESVFLPPSLQSQLRQPHRVFLYEMGSLLPRDRGYKTFWENHSEPRAPPIC